MQNSDYAKNMRVEGNYIVIGDGNDTKKYRIRQANNPNAVGTEVMANQALRLLQSTGLQFTSLAHTKITKEGIKTTQADVGNLQNVVMPIKPQNYDDNFKQIITLSKSSMQQGADVKPKPLIFKEIQNQPVVNPEIKKLAKDRLGYYGVVRAVKDLILKVFYREEYNAIQKHTYEKSINRMDKEANEMQNFNLNADPHYPVVTEKMLHKEYHLEKNPKTVVDIALEQEKYLDVPVFESGGIDVEPLQLVGVGQVVPEVVQGSDDEFAKGLANLYITVQDRDQENKKGPNAVIRHGVVNTELRGEEWVEAVLATAEAADHIDPDRPIRVVSMQYNAFSRTLGGEGKLINDQHAVLAMAGANHPEVEISHINLPYNKISEASKLLNKVPLMWLGSWLIGAEEKSHVQNLEGMATYLKWVLEDVGFEAERKRKIQEEINTKQNAIQTSNDSIAVTQLESDIEELRKKLNNPDDYVEITAQINWKLNLIASGSNIGEISQLEEEIDALRNKLKVSLQSKTFQLMMMGMGYGGTKYSDDQKQTIELMHKLLTMQLETSDEGINRDQEMMMYMLLNERLGVVTSMNCEHGTDTTGLAHAVCLALMQTANDIKFDLVMNWGQNTTRLNKITLDKIEKAENDPSAFGKYVDELKKNSKDKNTTDENRVLMENKLKIIEFRNKVMENVLKVSLPIASISSGVAGLRGLSENMSSLNFLPPVIKLIKGDGTNEILEVLQYDSDGELQGLTKVGEQIYLKEKSR